MLAGRLIVDDPNGWEQDYLAGERVHGTAMASLIVRGDLSSPGAPLSRPLYVRPIMRPDPRDSRPLRAEAIPSNVLTVDLLHTAVKRIYEGEGDTPAVAPTVRVLNLSIGDRNRPLDGPMSPFARMIDWLSWKYRTLFLVSAGNDPDDIELDVPRGEAARLSATELAAAVARGIHQKAHLRRILSPSESVNAITVGSVHDDDSDVALPANSLNVYQAGFPSPINRIGLGFKRGIKPDLLLEGGTQIYRPSPLPNAANEILQVVGTQRNGPGQLASSPGQGAELRAVRFSCGTSNATAIGTRACDSILAMLDELPPDWSQEQTVVLTKALLAHGSSWTDAAGFLKETLGLGDDYRDHVARYLGYGPARIEHALSCAPHRATVISADRIRDEQGHVYEFPLPPSLSGVVGVRRLVITLAWLTPTNPLHRDYRRAGLWISKVDSVLKASRVYADWQTVQRGTLQHEVFEGKRAVAFVDGASIRIKVNCRADAGRLEEEIPYAIAVTLEAAEELRIPVYEEIAERIEIQDEVRIH
jgi:hypothetical protein